MIALDNASAAIASVRRASAADRQSAMAFDVEFRPLATLESLVEPWRELAAHAIEPNVFYEPAFALAAAPLLGADVMAGLVWSRDPGRQLAGFFPVRVDRHRYGLPLPVLVGWTHPYAPLGTPLVHREMAEPAIAAWLDHITRDADLPDLLLMRFLADEGPFAAALASVLARHGCESRSFDRHERALLAPGENRAGYFERTMPAKRQRELRRQRRRLDELGTVTLAEADSSDMAAALEDFLALEAAGWKGRAGTAAMQNEDVLHFVRRAVAGLEREGKASVHRLLLNGQAIAATVTLTSGNTAWGWKVAYDEIYAPYSPGVLLLAASTEALLSGTAVAHMDSCATATQTMMNQLWRERLAVSDCLMAARPGMDLSFAFASRLETLRRTAMAAAKSLRDHLRLR
jgi:CelD/BcsL family acetyltransferase involved in cellulose biosynthesis